MSSAINCKPAVNEASTAGSMSMASMVEVESGLTGSSFEIWFGRSIKGEVGGEIIITSESVDTAALEGRTSSSGLDGSKCRKSEFRFEKIAKMLS